jgi:deoxyhypusine synthase
LKSKSTKKTDKNILSDSVRDYKIESNSISLLIDGMANSGGFESKNLWNGIDIIRTMTKDRNCTRFLSFVGSIISTGARGIIKDMLKRKMFDCVITTCGALDHDIARTSTKYYSGDFRMDDGMLYRKNIHRLGNVLVPQNNYGPVIENKMQACLNNLYKQGLRSISTFDITRSIGET